MNRTYEITLKKIFIATVLGEIREKSKIAFCAK